MELIIMVAKKYVGNTVEMDGKAMIFTMIFPTNKRPYFTLCNMN